MKKSFIDFNLMKKLKKAQLKIQQTAFMLIALTIFFALVGLFFVAIMLSGMKDSAESLNEKNAMLLVSKLANSPEFSCGDSFGTSKTNCVDFDKIMALKQNIDIYEGFWKDIDSIEVRKIYPSTQNSQNPVKCDIGNYPDCDVIRIKNEEVSGTYSDNFVSLCWQENNGDRFYEECVIGKLMVSYETIE